MQASVASASGEGIAGFFFAESVDHVPCLLILVDLEYVHVFFAGVHVQTVAPFAVYMSGGLHVSSLGFLY